MRRIKDTCQKLLAPFLILLIASETFAVIDFKIHEDFVSPRALGMGGAYSAIVDDYSAIYLNPAGLARRDNGRFNLYLIQATLGGDFNKLTSQASGSGSSEDSTQKFNELLTQLYGSKYHLRTSILGGHYVRKGWGISVMPTDLSGDLYVNNQTGPQVTAVLRNDTTLAYGWGSDFNWVGPHQLSLGVTGKLVYREYYANDISAIDLGINPNIIRPSDMSEGLAADLIVGSLFSPSIPTEGFFSWLQYAKPTFSMVIRNLIDGQYLSNFHVINPESSYPPRLGRRLDIGSVWEYPTFWIFKPRGALEFRNIGHPQWTFLKGLHLGGDLGWEVGNWLKGSYSLGINQGYLTAGVAAHLIWFHLDLATFGEEVGTSVARAESRSWLLRMSLDF